MAEPNSAVGAAQIHEAVRAAFGLRRITEKGTKVSAMFILFHQRIWTLWQTRCFNIGHSQHPSRPSRSKQPTTKADAANQKLIDLLAA